MVDYVSELDDRLHCYFEQYVQELEFSNQYYWRNSISNLLDGDVWASAIIDPCEWNLEVNIAVS
jgi:hypothetical protein